MKTVRKWVAGVLLAGLAAGCNGSGATTTKTGAVVAPKAAQKTADKMGLENPPPP